MMLRGGMAPPQLLQSLRGGFTESRAPIPMSLVKRLRVGYQSALAGNDALESPQWAFNNLRKYSIHEVLMGNDEGRLAEIVSDPSSNDLFFGFDNLFAEDTQTNLVP